MLLKIRRSIHIWSASAVLSFACSSGDEVARVPAPSAQVDAVLLEWNGGATTSFGYEVFIVPGLITMAMVQAAYSNNSSSVFQARSDRYINDVLSAPMHAWQMNIGYQVGGIVRSVAIGLGLGAIAVPITGTPIREPIVLVAAIALGLLLFAALGTVVGIYAETFDHHMFVNNILILPLVFVGGVFYSVARLPSPWHELSHVNPLFYLVSAVRYGFLGHADVSVLLALGVTAALAIPVYLWSQWLFTTGRRLKA